MKTYRHGDVIVREVKSIPTKAKELSTKKAVLALGEVTGHSHQVNGALAFFGFDEERYLKIQRGIGALTHEEHGRIELPAGNYEVIIQRDYEPDGWKKVQD